MAPVLVLAAFTADFATMTYITQTIAYRKGDVSEIIDDATHDLLKASPRMTIRKLFESLVERQLNLTRVIHRASAHRNI